MLRKTKNVAELKKNEEIQDLFVVRFKKPIREYGGGKYFFTLDVCDRTGEIMLKYWGSENYDEVKELYDKIQVDDVILVEGYVAEYRGKLEIHASAIEVVSPENYNPEDFVGKSPRDIDEMVAELKTYISKIKDDDYRKILERVFSDDFLKEFSRAPAAMFKHHNYIGGLIEHTLNMIKICERIYEIYRELDLDLMIAGCMLHDIGKVEEFVVGNTIKMTHRGRLVGHISLGINILMKHLEEMDISEEKKIKLIHIIISHHGDPSTGSPKTPMFPEALAVHYADLVDSQIKLMLTHKEAARTEDDYIYTKEFGTIYLR